MFSVVRTRTFSSLSIVLFVVTVIVAAQLVMSSAGTSPPPPPSQQGPLNEAAAATVANIVKPASPSPAPASAPAPAPAPTHSAVPEPAPAPAAPVAAAPTAAPTDPAVVPPLGQATGWGCAAALAYLQAHAAKGFTLECPGYAEGHEAMTCMNEVGVCPGSSVIAIADPCPQAYMNETSNSYVIAGVASSPIDPYGPCP